MGKNAHALLAALDTACANVDELGQASAELFERHPDYAIITSFPGLADPTGAQVLAEIGDDCSRFADARALKAYAGSAPIARASGRSLSVTHRHIKNNRLANVGWSGKTATVMPPPPAICSTNSSASCTTAPNTTSHSTRPRPFRCRCARRPSDTSVANLDDPDRVAK
jgi:hypothetical protein